MWLRVFLSGLRELVVRPSEPIDWLLAWVFWCLVLLCLTLVFGWFMLL